MDRSPERLDRLGILASTACAVHCALLPLAVGALATAGAGWLASERVEWTLLAATLSLGVASLLPSFRRHRNRRPLTLFLAGTVTLLSTRLALDDDGGLERSLVVAGALLIAAAHALNLRVRPVR